MIILNNNNNANVNIPDYDDLVNKPSINGVVLEGNKTTAELGIDIDTTNFYTKREVNERIADSITGIENEFGNYYTKTQSDSKYQPKGNYLTSIPSGYATESWVENKGYLTSIPSEYITESELSGKNYATKSEIPTIPTNISSFNNDSGYITINALSGYATETYVSDNYQPKGNYLTTIPSEYITESELQQKDFATNSDVNDEIGKLDSSLSFEIGKKQDTLVSGTNIKTINGISLLGSGNIVITGSGEGGSVDLSDYYTKGEVDNLIDNVEVDLTGYATETYVSDNYQPKGNYLTSIPSEYVTETELQGKNYATKSEIPVVPTTISSFTNDSGYITINALSGYATTTQLNSKQDELVSGTNIKTINGQSLLGSGNITIEGGTGGSGTDLSNYYTKGEVDGLISNLDTSVAENYYTILEVDELVESVEPDLTGYATETWVGNHYQTKGDYATTSYVDTQIGNINTILENIIG